MSAVFLCDPTARRLRGPLFPSDWPPCPESQAPFHHTGFPVSNISSTILSKATHRFSEAEEPRTVLKVPVPPKTTFSTTTRNYTKASAFASRSLLSQSTHCMEENGNETECRDEAHRGHGVLMKMRREVSGCIPHLAKGVSLPRCLSGLCLFPSLRWRSQSQKFLALTEWID